MLFLFYPSINAPSTNDGPHFEVLEFTFKFMPLVKAHLNYTILDHVSYSYFASALKTTMRLSNIA